VIGKSGLVAAMEVKRKTAKSGSAKIAKCKKMGEKKSRGVVRREREGYYHNTQVN